MATNKNIKTVSQDELEPKATTIGIPLYIWKAVKNASTERVCSDKEIWIEAICKYLDIPLPPAEQQNAA